MATELSDADRGKAVVNSNERIATFTEVVDDTVSVDRNWNDVPEDVRTVRLGPERRPDAARRFRSLDGKQFF